MASGLSEIPHHDKLRQIEDAIVGPFFEPTPPKRRRVWSVDSDRSNPRPLSKIDTQAESPLTSVVTRMRPGRSISLMPW